MERNLKRELSWLDDLREKGDGECTLRIGHCRNMQCQTHGRRIRWKFQVKVTRPFSVKINYWLLTSNQFITAIHDSGPQASRTFTHQPNSYPKCDIDKSTTTQAPEKELMNDTCHFNQLRIPLREEWALPSRQLAGTNQTCRHMKKGDYRRIYLHHNERVQSR